MFVSCPRSKHNQPEKDYTEIKQAFPTLVIPFPFNSIFMKKCWETLSPSDGSLGSGRAETKQYNLKYHRKKFLSVS